MDEAHSNKTTAEVQLNNREIMSGELYLTWLQRVHRTILRKKWAGHSQIRHYVLTLKPRTGSKTSILWVVALVI